MVTKVVNMRKEPYDIYIGRPSTFGSPMKIGEIIHQKPDPVTREEAVAWYREYFYARLKQQPEFKKAVESLRGKVLGCYCKPLPCHGDVIVEYLEQENEQKGQEV